MSFLNVGDVFPITSGQENRIVALEKRDGAQCHYCGHPLSRFYNRCVAIEYHADYWYTPEAGDQCPGYYPTFESFLPDGCKPIHIDHKLPRAKGGSGRLDNLVLSCADCNQAKSHRFSYEDFKALGQAVQA